MKRHPWLEAETIILLMTMLAGLVATTTGTVVWAYSTFTTQKDIGPINSRADRQGVYSVDLSKEIGQIRADVASINGKLEILLERSKEK